MFKTIYVMKKNVNSSFEKFEKKFKKNMLLPGSRGLSPLFFFVNIKKARREPGFRCV